MNEKEIGELRRRLRPEKNNITAVCGCYVNEKREVISLFDAPLTTMGSEDTEHYLGLLRKVMTGQPDKNLIDISFSTAQVMDSDEHRLLMTLRQSALRDTGALETFYQRIIDSIALDGQYLILLAADTYDVPYRTGFGEAMPEASDSVFRYFLCAVCPVKETQAALCYAPQSNDFRTGELLRTVSAPELGFTFPAFDDRTANLYDALYYVRDPDTLHPEVIDALFRTPLPQPATAQKESFNSVLSGTLAEECSYDVMQSVHDQLCEALEQHKAEKDPEPLKVSRNEVRRMLAGCGVSAEKVSAFEEKYDEQFGRDTDLLARNLVDAKKLEVRTPDVVIHVNPERGDLLETRVIDGTRYILICAEDGVEVNGVTVHITDKS